MKADVEEYKNLTSEEKIKETLGKPRKNTLKYFVISSVVYLIVFSAAWLFAAYLAWALS